MEVQCSQYLDIEVIEMSALIDLTGQKFGEWTVLGKGNSDKHCNTKWVC